LCVARHPHVVAVAIVQRDHVRNVAPQEADIGPLAGAKHRIADELPFADLGYEQFGIVAHPDRMRGQLAEIDMVDDREVIETEFARGGRHGMFQLCQSGRGLYRIRKRLDRPQRGAGIHGAVLRLRHAHSNGC
jgi:hypothetical protein